MRVHRSSPWHMAVVAVALGGAAAAGPALAQDRKLQQAPLMPGPRTTVPETMAPPLKGDPTDSTGTLSDQLRQSEGVIQPPAGIDPAIRKTPPESPGAVMPVIPPPGEPGGDPQVQPK